MLKHRNQGSTLQFVVYRTHAPDRLARLGAQDHEYRPNSRIDLVTAFHLSTAGGGSALDLPIGVIASGYRFDIVAIDTKVHNGGIRLFGQTEPTAIFEKIIYDAARANIAAVWIDGVAVRPAPDAQQPDVRPTVSAIRAETE